MFKRRRLAASESVVEPQQPPEGRDCEAASTLRLGYATLIRAGFSLRRHDELWNDETNLPLAWRSESQLHSREMAQSKLTSTRESMSAG